MTPDLWSQIERFVKSSAKRADTLPRFIETLKPRLACDTIHPAAALAAPNILPVSPERRQFLTGVIERADQRDVLDRLYRETAYVVLLVRDRLEREKPIEAKLDAQLDSFGPVEVPA